MLKRHRLLLLLLLTLPVVVAVVVAVFIATFDWNRARPWLQARIGAAIERDVAIDGDLTATWRWHIRHDDAEVWSPGLRVMATNIRIGNPEWAKGDAFAQLGAIEMDVRLAPLLSHTVVVPHVRLVQPSLDFERRKDASNNWTFTSPGSAPAWTVEMGEVEFDAGDIAIVDAERVLDVHVAIKALDAPIPFGQRVDGDDPSTRREVIQRVGRAAAERLREAADARASKRKVETPPPYLFGWTAKGTMRGVKVEGDGRFGGALAFDNSHRPFPIRADVDVGSTEIALTGTITDPASPDAIDMRLWITGSNLADLYPIAGLSLPRTPSYATVGRLTGHFHPHRSSLRYEDFSARVGGSDLAGTLGYKSGDPRATLTGNVDSTLLQVEDLGTLVGVDPAVRKAANGDSPAPPAGRVLPDAPFDVERWDAMDADVHFTGKRIVRVVDLPIRDVDTQIVMKNGQLSLDPLRFGMAGGNVKASLRIDANAKPPRGTIALDAQKLLLRRLFAHTDGLSTGEGEVNATTHLSGRGKSIADILSTSDGSLKVLMTEGKVSEALMEKAGLNLGNVLLSKLTGDRQISIDCAAADFTAKDGVLASDVFVFDTENALIDIDGQIRLSDETIDLTVHPQTRGLRLFSLRSPLHVKGSFRQVDVGVDRKQLLLRGGAALGLGLVAAPAALLALTALGGDAPKACARLIEQAKQAGVRVPTSRPAAPSTGDHGKTSSVKPAKR